MKKRDAQRDYITASRKGSREAEIEMYGRPLGHRKVHRSKKKYNRKTAKAAMNKLPFFILPFWFVSDPTALYKINPGN